MQQLTKAIQLAARIATTVVKNPAGSRKALALVPSLAAAFKETSGAADLLEHLPTMIQGAEFSRQTEIAISLKTGADRFEVNNALRSYFDAHKEGPGIWKWKHYFDIYQRHLQKFVGREVHVLEIGIYSGGSLPMWREYFGPGCHIYGIDIEEACNVYKADKTEIFIGDQADRSFWAKLRKAVPTVDIVIDDGGHTPHQQRVTLEEMLPHIRPGGVYLCEDIHGASNEFAVYLSGLASSLHSMAVSKPAHGVAGIASEALAFQRGIRGMHMYPYVAVIEKRDEAIDQFVAPKHGTQWQPFL